MKIHGNFSCSDCGNNVKALWEFHYMLKSEIWLTVAKSSELLCISCLEIRLKRKLTPDDFTNESINRKNFGKKSARLLNRLSKLITKENLIRSF
jgi:hypothetical protein